VGIVSKQFHQRTTNKVVAPVRSVTKLDAEQALAIVRGVVMQTPPKARVFGAANRLWLAGAAPGPWTVYFGPPSAKDPTKVVPSWQAKIAIEAASSRAETLITIQLAKWKTHDGALVDKKNYDLFRDNVHANLNAEDPTHRLLEVP
jgi:hypothetical protein